MIGPPYLTLYERVRIIADRAAQIAAGAPILLDELPEGVRDPIKIAELELEKGLLPVVIERRTLYGKSQLIKLSDLLEKKDEEKKRKRKSSR